MDGGEPFWHTSVIIIDEEGRRQSLNPTMEFRRRLGLDWGSTGVPKVHMPQGWIRVRGDVGLADARVVLGLTEELFLYSEATVGLVLASAIESRDIAEEVALIDLKWQYEQFLAGEPVARHVRQLDQLLPSHASMKNTFQSDGSWFPNGTMSWFQEWLAGALGEARARQVIDFSK